MQLSEPAHFVGNLPFSFIKNPGPFGFWDLTLAEYLVRVNP